MLANSIVPAIQEGDTIVSFGSGDSGGRTQASARGTAGRTSASPAQVRALRSRINRASGLTRAQRRQLLSDIDENTSRRGGIRRGILASIASDLADLT